MKRLTLFCILFLAGKLFAAPIVSGSSGDWNNPATWVGGVIPTASDIVTIANGHTVTVTANTSCASVVIGNGPLDQNTNLSLAPGITLTVSGNISISAPLAGTTDNALNVDDGAVSCTSLLTGNAVSDALRCLVNIGGGTLSCGSSFLMANNTVRNKLIFSGNGILQIGGTGSTLADAQFTPAAGTVEYNGAAAQNILSLSYYTLKCSGAGNKILTANTVLTGNLLIAGTASLDVSAAGNYSLTVGGNWTVTSTSANPFVERKGTVTLNGSSGVQTITTTLSQESFYNLIINNTAANGTADIVFNNTCTVSQEYTHTSGKIDLKGKRLSITSDNRLASFSVCNLSGGSIISSVAGALVIFADTYDSTFVNFNGTSIGDNSIPVQLSVSTGRINIENLVLYGAGTFSKELGYDDILSKGGNKFYNDVTFNCSANCGNWYMSAGAGAVADSFFAKITVNSYATNAAGKFILGAHSTGNYYAGTATFYVRSAGSVSVGCNSGAANGTGSSNTFVSLVDVSLNNSGNIVFAEGTSTLPASVTFRSTLRLSSAAGSTGSIYVGRNVSGSSVTISNTGQLTNGSFYGNTSVYLYNITQNGSLAQSLSNFTFTTSKIIAGDINGPCTWSGPVTISASVIDLAYNNFNGSPNNFSIKNTSVLQNCTGGNSFATGTITSFTNYSAIDWYFATVTGDDYNGDVYYRVTATGSLYPAYNSNCTYAGNIVVLPSSDTVIFADGTNGRVTIDGSTSTYFLNNSIKQSTLKRLTINKPGGTFSLYSNLLMPAGGNLVLTSGKIVTSSTGLLILMDETCTTTNTTANSTSYIDGPMRINVSTTALQNLHFPIGKSGDSRPVDLTIQHSTSTSYSYTVEMTRTDANTLGWTNPASIYNVSTMRWWDITRTVTSTGVAAPVTDLITSPLPVVSFYYGLTDRAPNLNPADVTIIKNTYTATTSWIDIGASGATNSVGKITSTSSPSAFNSFSRFTIGYYGKPPAPTGRDSSICGTGTAVITATPVYGEFIDWYAAASGGTALATNTTSFTTPVISSTTTYYAQARNTKGYVSTTRTAVTAFVYNTPVASSFTPAIGETGTTITITGSNFNNNVSAVTFGGTAATSFTVNSTTQITAVVAGGASGAVAVTNGCGTGSKTGFIFNPLTVWTGAVNTSWTNAGNWDDGVPTAAHSAVIPNVANQPQITSNQVIKSITVQSGATVDIAAGNSLNVKDSATNNGTVSGGGALILSGTASQPLNGNGTYENLTLNNNAGAIIASGGSNTVNITGKYTPTVGVLTTNNNLVLKSNASQNGIIITGSAAGGYINGKVVLERYIPARRAWRLINFPVTSSGVPNINTALQEGAGGNTSSNPNPGYGTHITGGTIANGFDQSPFNNASAKEWIGGAWQAITTTNAPVDNTYPYFIFVRGSRAINLNAGANTPADNTTLRLTANVKQGNQTLSLSGTGWQLTGNPFPSVVNLDAVAAGNSSKINRNFIFWDPKLGGSNNVGGFVTASYNGAGYDFTPTPVSPLSEYAQPFAGFYVDAIATGNISILESNKCNCGNGNVFRPAPSRNTTSKIRVNLLSVNADGSTPVVDGTMVAFDNMYSNEHDSYDVNKLTSTLSENIAVSGNGKKLSIERRNKITANDTLLLNIANMRVKGYQLEIVPENFDHNTALWAYLEDSYTGERKQLDLFATNTHSFSIINTPAAYASGRFRIVFETDKVAVQARKNATLNNSSVSAANNIHLLENPVTNNTIRLSIHNLFAGRYALTLFSNDGKEMSTTQFMHDGTDGIKTIRIREYLQKGFCRMIIKGENGISIPINTMIQ